MSNDDWGLDVRVSLTPTVMTCKEKKQMAQAMLRAGATVSEVAAKTGLPRAVVVRIKDGMRSERWY